MELELYLHLFLTSARDGSRWPASRLDRSTHGERPPATHSVGAWLGPRADVDTIVKNKTLQFNHDSCVIQPIA